MTVFFVPLISISVAFLIGGVLGLLAVYRGGLIDVVLTRIFDLMLAFPAILIALVLIAAFGQSRLTLGLGVLAVFVPRAGRTVRGATQSVVAQDYVAAAEARGEGTFAILVRELLPNVVGPVIADYALRFTYAIILVASLNFLGLGEQPPSSDWGVMVAQSRDFLIVNPWGTIAPALGIAALSVSTNLVADSLSRHLSVETAMGITET
jgi:peptide/nickel transport system permease protein